MAKTISVILTATKYKPFISLTADELVFGYDDTLVSLAHRFYPRNRRPMEKMGLLNGVSVCLCVRTLGARDHFQLLGAIHIDLPEMASSHTHTHAYARLIIIHIYDKIAHTNNDVHDCIRQPRLFIVSVSSPPRLIKPFLRSIIIVPPAKRTKRFTPQASHNTQLHYTKRFTFSIPSDNSEVCGRRRA